MEGLGDGGHIGDGGELFSPGTGVIDRCIRRDGRDGWDEVGVA